MLFPFLGMPHPEKPSHIASALNRTTIRLNPTHGRRKLVREKLYQKTMRQLKRE